MGECSPPPFPKIRRMKELGAKHGQEISSLYGRKPGTHNQRARHGLLLLLSRCYCFCFRYCFFFLLHLIHPYLYSLFLAPPPNHTAPPLPTNLSLSFIDGRQFRRNKEQARSVVACVSRTLCTSLPEIRLTETWKTPTLPHLIFTRGPLGACEQRKNATDIDWFHVIVGPGFLLLLLLVVVGRFWEPFVWV